MYVADDNISASSKSFSLSCLFVSKLSNLIKLLDISALLLDTSVYKSSILTILLELSVSKSPILIILLELSVITYSNYIT